MTMTRERVPLPEWYTKRVDDAHHEYHRRMADEWQALNEQAQRLAASIDKAKWEAINEANRDLQSWADENGFRFERSLGFQSLPKIVKPILRPYWVATEWGGEKTYIGSFERDGQAAHKVEDIFICEDDFTDVYLFDDLDGEPLAIRYVNTNCDDEWVWPEEDFRYD